MLSVNNSPLHTKHNTLTFTRSDLFHPATCCSQSPWP